MSRNSSHGAFCLLAFIGFEEGWRLNWLNCVCLQGIDLIAGGRNKKNAARTAPKSDNVYLKLLVKVGCSSSNSTQPSEDPAADPTCCLLHCSSTVSWSGVQTATSTRWC